MRNSMLLMQLLQQRKKYHTSNQKVDLGPDQLPGGSRPGIGLAGNDGDVQRMRARPLAPWRASGLTDIVALTSRSCRHNTHA